ncbi:MAG: cation transporter [Betaproteobacteria bacterium]|nr:cation transporter [Betaproteobacteria bacterium]
MSARSPIFYAGLSIVTSIFTIVVKFMAYSLTGSVGLLSDALESFVNLAAALVALATLSYAHSGADEDHNFGHEKAEYFSSGIEGALIFVAAAAIIWSAVPRLIAPQPIEQVGLGLVLSVVAAGANLLCGWALLKGAREHRSITLEADAHHLLTDVWTTVGVIIGVGLVAATGWLLLDALIAIAVALQILWTGFRLMRRSFDGLMDRAIPPAEREAIVKVLEQVRALGGDYHRLRTRAAGKVSFVDVHVLVPGTMSVHAGHDLVEKLENEIRAQVPHVEVLTHLEPVEDPRSWEEGRA